MSSEVKRYDAVHIRYEDNNIRYGEGCEVEVVTAADYEREVRIAIAAGQRMQDKCDALQAEAEALRGLTPELPPRPPEGAGLPRYGLRWNGPAQPLSVPMDDGYWTPWHLAEALRVENERLRQELAESRNLIVEMSTHCNATALVTGWLERNT